MSCSDIIALIGALGTVVSACVSLYALQNPEKACSVLRDAHDSAKNLFWNSNATTKSECCECPATQPPTTEPLTTEPSTTQSPTTEPLTNEPSTTQPPTTEPPTTQPPTTEPPTTEPPTTEPPTTQPPTTEPPTTEPSTTQPPTTEPPTTKPKGQKVILYEDTEYEGKYFEYFIEEHNCTNVESWMDNKASSIKIEGKCVILCDKKDCQGHCPMVSSEGGPGYCKNLTDLSSGCDFDNKATSIKLC